MKKEREFSPELAADLIKATFEGGLLRAKHNEHPNSYDWHDGHSSHHEQGFDLTKADAHPHMDAPPKNDQAAGVGVSTYKQFAAPYGNVNPSTAPDLLHYNYHDKLPDVQKLVQDHGYKTYYAGGRYGKPDLANKNYNTGHIMVYDPSPNSGGDFNHEKYTDAWRQIHELSHALTLPELNKQYGEGRRIGKLGTHRTANEALRAVHWEWLAAHKQRELSKKIGVHLKDEDFNKELGTVMHDAVHRAVTGKFTEPSSEGFTPHSHQVPLYAALQMVRDSAHGMGLRGLHDLLPKINKSEMLSPKVAGITKPAMHNTVEGFMGALTSMPKGDSSRGKHITSHMNHGPFLQALSSHPQGKKIHAMLTQHLNGIGNAGFRPGQTQAVAKIEKTMAIFELSQGENVSEKLYSIAEVNEILMKSTKEKVEEYASEIKKLQSRELKKSLIPNHKHNEGTTASMGVEDVPPGKANPKGVAKSEPLCKKCNKCHELNKCGELEKARVDDGKSPQVKASDRAYRNDRKIVRQTPDNPKANELRFKLSGGEAPGSKKMKIKGTPHQQEGVHLPARIMGIKVKGSVAGIASQLSTRHETAAGREHYNSVAHQAHSEVLGRQTKKAELVDEKGNRSDNSTRSDSSMPGKKSAVVSAEGSGGKIPTQNESHSNSLSNIHNRASFLKKSGDSVPMAKPPSGSMTKVPMSKPKVAKMPTMKSELEKGLMADVARAADPTSAAHKAPVKNIKLPTPEQHADRAANFSAAINGEFAPKAAPVSSPVLKSPKSAGVTRSAGPVMNAARPAPAARPGIFGKLFGKS
jgi:hypothetical protein